MKKQIVLLAVSLMTALAWGQSPAVKVEGGMIQGVPSAASGVTVFRGIPYAAPPVGDLRWKRPQPVVTSQYWNIAYGAGKGEVKLDTEGMQTMRTLATNMAFLLQKIHADGHPAPQRDERPQFMNFIR